MFFDGADDILTSSTVGLYGAGRTIAAMVFNGPSWVTGLGSATGHLFAETNGGGTNGRYILGSRGSAAGQETRGSAYIITDAGATLMNAYKSALFDGTWHQATAVDTGTAFTLRGDGASGAATAYARSGLTPTVTVMGGRVHTSGGINAIRANVREIIAFTADLDFDDVAVIEANQRTRFELS